MRTARGDVLMWQIPIYDGTDYYNKYLFSAVEVSGPLRFFPPSIRELEPVISVDAFQAEHLLFYFFKKFFDPFLEYNKDRETDYLFVNGDERDYHFYTYQVTKQMISEMKTTADLLETDFDNPLVAPIVAEYDIFCLIDPGSDAWVTGNFGSLKDNIPVACDFYRRLACRLTELMDRNPSANLINVEFGY